MSETIVHAAKLQIQSTGEPRPSRSVATVAACSNIPIRRGRGTSSPLQFGQTFCISAAHAAQNVQPNEQKHASPPGGVGVAHRSQRVFISSAISGSRLLDVDDAPTFRNLPTCQSVSRSVSARVVVRRTPSFVPVFRRFVPNKNSRALCTTSSQNRKAGGRKNRPGHEPRPSSRNERPRM